MRKVMRTAGVTAAGLLVVLVVGCQQPSTMAQASQRQDQALKDPMGYTPNMDNTDISGGGIGNYDNQAMQRDLNDIFNP
ncbi:MAG: hypothetical protein ABSH22_13285 [Tepidisphaeraceae bacterium]|jgi:hypothetical protein